eukprot:TRINITY_DN6811_c0_g1_i2.p1 TRINITY_DN6811_c0_g1~~TRINITY_DN6811_c0_g1_i2.p1  ORF type:complete len:872 (-),score=227.40 TRINITY_DN6811_c0_g1_i2:65-2641(-)
MAEHEDNLLQEEAQTRSRLINNVKYTLKIILASNSTSYNGNLTVSFSFKKKDQTDPNSLFLDAVCEQVQHIVTNGSKQEVPSGKVVRISLDADKLVEGDNVVEISYRNEKDKTGDGFHHFVDPQDQEEYHYTNFEPFYCHRLFPCFDQPDLKAPLTITVDAPQGWVVVTNSKITEQQGEAGLSRWTAEPTPPLSPYLYALMVGPYKRLDDNYGDVPMSVYCRSSLLPYLKDDVVEFFEVTKQGLKFYEDFFGYKYPFSKYDQIFCPEFNVGAMENPGAITFTENYVYRETPTDSRRLNRAETLLHEMAHMWFGDLVSPVWWDGLWLNESFATYMAYLAMAEATRFGSRAWVDFHTLKRWAYREDQLATTHPIQGVVPDTNSTFLNFDGITYAKGASVLKQLVAVVGMEGFKRGMQIYFRRHEWGNTVISDFIGAIEEGAQVSLQEWSKIWLETSEINTLTSSFETNKDGNLTALVVQQTAPKAHPVMRPHHIDIAVYDWHQGTVQCREVVSSKISGSTTRLDGPLKDNSKVPGAVYLNHNDHAYAKIALDKDSLDFVMKHIDKFEDPLARLLLWSSLNNMVRDAQLSSVDFLALVRSKVATETNDDLVDWLISTSEKVAGTYVPHQHKVREYSKLHQLALERLRSVDTPDKRIMWAKAAIQTVSSDVEASAILGMFDKTGIADFELDQDMRWNAVIKAAAFGVPEWEARLKVEEARDTSDRGQRRAATCRASPPDAALKEEKWNVILNDEAMSKHMLSAIMSGFRHWNQVNSGLLAPYDEKFFACIQNLAKTRPHEFVEPFVYSLFPSEGVPDTSKAVQMTEALIGRLDESKDTFIKRLMREQLDDLHRMNKCIKLVQ